LDKNRNPRFPRTTIVLFLLAIICSSIPAAVPESPVDRLHSHVAWLADAARQGRRAGSRGAADSAKYVSDQFRQLGFDVQMQEFGGNRRNVVARYGSASRIILAGAHYDGQGPGFPSASDNAAGIAVLLELARDMKAANLSASLVMCAFDDEEQGLNGSLYFADHPTVPLENVYAAVVFDALGRHFMDLREWTTIILGEEYSPELSALIQKHSGKDMQLIGADLIGPRSDFAPFASMHVPFLFFSDGTYKDYHGAGDTAERVDYMRLSQETTLIGQVIRDVAALKARPVYRENPVYPEGEAAGLLKLMNTVIAEKANLPPAYRLMFDDLKTRMPTDKTRDSIRMSTSAFLALATPSHARYFLESELKPYFESLHKPDIVKAIQEESTHSGL
jgi:hypothetical protein